MDLISCKQRFFEENTDFTELKGGAQAMTIGEFHEIDELEDEVWLMQCPKGTDVVTELEGQKLKLPGRSNFSAMEAVALEFPNVENHAFGYCNRKGRYSLRLLPVRGSILLRSRLMPTEMVTADTVETLCPPMGRVPMPEVVKVRHPLHGHQFDEHLRLDSGVTARLKQADEVSAQVLHEVLMSKMKAKDTTKRFSPTKAKRKSVAAAAVIHIDSGADEDVEFVSETKAKQKKKRKHSETALCAEEHVPLQAEESASKKKKKSKKSKEASGGEEVSQDLQWLQKI